MGRDLMPWGYSQTDGVLISIEASNTAYCLTADQADLTRTGSTSARWANRNREGARTRTAEAAVRQVRIRRG
jgi:hypothetical protein